MFPTNSNPRNLPLFNLFYLRYHFLHLLLLHLSLSFPHPPSPQHTHTHARTHTRAHTRTHTHTHFPALECLSPHCQDTTCNWRWSEHLRIYNCSTQHVGLLWVPPCTTQVPPLHIPSRSKARGDSRVHTVIQWLSHGIITILPGTVFLKINLTQKC